MRRLLAGLMAAALAGSLAACGTSSDSSGSDDAGGVDKVKVGVIPIVDVAPIYLGQKQGFFSKRNIELTMETGQGGAAIVPGVVSGQFQFGFSNFTSLMIAQTKNVPIKAVAAGVASTGEQGKDFGAVVVTKDSPIKTAADLVGKKVSVNTLKNIGDTVTRESVRKAGGDGANVDFVEMPFPNMQAALEKGDVDAAWVVEPSLSAIKAAGGREVASTFVDAADDLTVAAYFTSTKLLADDPDLVKRFTDAINESLGYADAHPDEVRSALGTYTKIDATLGSKLVLPKWPTQINEPSVQTLAKLGEQDGIFSGAPDLEKLLPGHRVAATRSGSAAPPSWALPAWPGCSSSSNCCPGSAWSTTGTCRRPAGSPSPWPARRATRSSGPRSATPSSPGRSAWPSPSAPASSRAS